MDTITLVPPGRPIVGRVAPPGSKSITNRALLIAGLAKGRSRLTGALKSDDTLYMAGALRDLGVTVEEPDETSFNVTGSGRLAAPTRPLFLGNAGTATRFLTAAAALVDGTVVIDGDQHMRRRPIEPLVAALRRLGIDAEATGGGCPPVTVKGRGRVPGGRVVVDASLSSQYLSALLMLAACGDGPIEVALEGAEIGARGYVDLTLAAMRGFGAKARETGEGAWLVEPTGYQATDFPIEPDASAATYLWGAAALTRGQVDVGLPPDRFSQPDARAHALIARFPDMPTVIDGSQMQDAVPTLAVMAAFNRRPVRFVGITNLRVKECDRIRALSQGLQTIRPDLAREEGDELVVEADPTLAGESRPCSIETFHDHRIAMAFALAGLLVQHVAILDPDCVAKTYPDYWRALSSLGVEMARERS